MKPPYLVQQSQKGGRLRGDAEVGPLVVVVLRHGANRLAGHVPELDLTNYQVMLVLEKLIIKRVKLDTKIRGKMSQKCFLQYLTAPLGPLHGTPVENHCPR